MLVNIICALVGAIFGSWIGHLFTIKLYREKTTKQKKALYEEVSIIKADFLSCIKSLMDEFSNPLRDKYHGVPLIYTQLIENLIVELSSTDEILSTDQRVLLVRIANKNKSLSEKYSERDEFVDRWLRDGNELDASERQKIKKGIEFWTAQILIEVIDIIFHTAKFLEEKDNFKFGKYSLDMKINVVCQYGEITFDDSFWNKISNKI
ncbi:hypothetical protein C1E47_19515 [Vibrio cholerae]|nr:hypothetical protein [Vibrio cholerae]